jgi:fumarate reductase flavoprotein subunit
MEVLSQHYPTGNMPGGKKMYHRNSRKRTDIETLVAEVAVIGGGGGLAAAVAAAEKGAKVILLEKRKKTGGNIALARGLLAAESPVQKRMKIDARKEELFKTAMNYAHWTINPRIIRALMDKSGETIQWLEKMGVIFKDVPHSYTNQFPRIYHIPEGHGAKLAKVLLEKCENLDVEVLCETPAKRILTGKMGEVTGVLAVRKDKEIRINARGVIIATGGYSGNRELLKKYHPHYTDSLRLYGLPNMGDGFYLATEAGAATEGLGTILAMGPLFEGSPYVHAIAMESNTVWVNKKGERFVNEAYEVPSETANALNRQPDKISYTLLDEKIKRSFVEEGLIKGIESRFPITTRMTDLEKYLQKDRESGKVKISRSWKGIAEWIGADFGVLKNTIDEYNSYCDHGNDAMFYKDRRFLQPLLTPPFYALKCCQAFHGTIGGIKINHDMEVLDQHESRIAGLYAAGNDTGGWVSDTYCYVLTGTALAFAINSGRIAGENAAQYVSGK